MHANVKVIVNDDEFLALKEPWTDLAHRIEKHNVFSSWEWAYTWWISYKTKMKSCRLFVVLVYDNDSLIGIVPAYQHVIMGRFRILRLLGDRFETSLYLDFLVESSRQKLFASQLTSVLRQYRVVIIHSTGVAQNSYFQRFGSLGYCVIQEQFECSYVTLPVQFSSYLEQRRRNVQKDRKRLYNDVGARKVDLTKEGRKSLEALFDLHERGFKQRGETTRFRKETRLDFHANLCELLQATNSVYLLGVEHNGRIVAMSYGFRQGNTSVGYQLGYDPDYRRLGIGFQLILNEIEWAIENGLMEHDLSAGGASYKSVFCEESRGVYRVFVGCSGIGNNLLRLFRCYLSVRKLAVFSIRWLQLNLLRKSASHRQ